MQPDMLSEIATLFERFGSEHYGEAATQLDHALQCAQLAVEAACPPALVAAALLHDVGQFLDDAGNAAQQLNHDARHEETGAAWLARWFAPAVTEPVRLHVAAKRYLCAVEADYAASLSAASALSLGLQGGAMTAQECTAFASNPHFAAAVQLRRFDDTGKRPDWPVAPLATYAPLLASLAGVTA